MIRITLREIDQSNWRECIMLMPAPDQQAFIYSNLYSLAEAKYEPDWGLVPLGVYDDETLVGFVMYGRVAREGETRWFIFRLMVGEQFQGQGYGRAALDATIALMAERHGCDTLFISYAPENAVAPTLYQSVGFVDMDMLLDGDAVMRLNLTQGRKDAGNAKCIEF